ncbi:MAG: hypothetical protein HY887_05810 [Deltaproteobacteria bacterium]|nr:hypothetical protein [Deltaproteobacteria bacterium]
MVTSPDDKEKGINSPEEKGLKGRCCRVLYAAVILHSAFLILSSSFIPYAGAEDAPKAFKQEASEFKQAGPESNKEAVPPFEKGGLGGISAPAGAGDAVQKTMASPSNGLPAESPLERVVEKQDAAAILADDTASAALFPAGLESAMPRQEVSGGESYPIKKIAIFPFENMSAATKAANLILEMMKAELASRGISIADENVIDGFLAQKRIRFTGAVSRPVAREMGKMLGVDAVLLGTIDLFAETHDGAAVGVTARLVSTVDGAIVWAENLSYSGRDFEGFLGLGIVSSPEDLSARVLRTLLSTLPDTYVLNEEELRPFELESVAAEPALGKSGEKIRLQARFIPIMEDPAEVWAIVDGREVVLSRIGEGVFEGGIDAPQAETAYIVDFMAFDRYGRPFPFNSAIKFVVDNTPPLITMSLNRKVFSPRKQGAVIFTPKLSSLDSVDEWKMEIYDKKGVLVRSDKGYGKLPKGLIWKGETDKFQMVDEGQYDYRFTVKDPAGNETSLTGEIMVKQKVPDIKVEVDAQSDIIVFSFKTVKEETIASWKFSILNKEGKVVKTMSGQGHLPEVLEYPLESPADINNLTFSITATDDADNTFVITKAIPSFFTHKKTPFTKLKQEGEFTADF